MTNALVQASADLTQNVDVQKQLAKLDSMTAGINIAPNYMEFEEVGQKVRGVFLGFVDMEIVDKESGESKTLPCVAWIDEQQNVWQNGGTSLVSAFVTVELSPYSPVEIELIGSKKVAKGSMKQYAVRPLAEAQ